MKKGTARSTPGEREIKARVAQLTALHKTLLDITAQRDLTKLLRAIVQRAARLLKGTSGGLYLCDAEKQECTCVVSYKTPRDYTGTVLRYGEGAAGKVAANGQPLQIDDYRAWEGHAKAFESEQPFRAVLAAPLLWHGGVTGVIDVLREQPFTQADLELLTMFASQAAIAVENARALEVERATRIQAEKDITERKKAQEALRKSERDLQLTLDATTDGIYEWNFKTNVLFFSPRYYTMLGYDPGELPATYETWKSLIHLDDLAGALHVAEDYLSSKPDRYENEFRMRTKAAGYRWIHARSTVVERDEHGAAVRIIGNHEDITERKRAEEQIAYQAQLLAIVNDAVVASDAQYRLTAWNAAAESMYGWKAEEVLGRFGLDITRTEFPGVDKAEMLRAIAERGSWRGEATQARKDGTRIPVEVSSMVLRDESGQITGYVSVNRDITERKRAEEEITHLAKFPAENPNPVLRLSRDGIVIYANAASDALLGMWDCAVGSYAPQSWRDLIAQALACGQNKSIDVECAEKVYSFFVAPVAEAGYVNLYGRDITERKRAEEALREAEAWFRTTLYSIGDAVITTDAKSRVQQMNPVAEALTGWREAEARGKPLAEVFYIVNEETRRAVENPITRVLREGVVIGLGNHTLLIARDGTERPIADAGAPIHNDRGEAVGVVLVFRDQTAERAAQKALRESEARFSTIFRASPIGIGVTRLADGQVSDLNDTFLGMFGYVREEVIGRTTLELKLWACPEDRDRLFKMLLEQGRVRDFEAQFRKKSGEIGTLLVSAEVIDLAGERYMLSLMHDITERKRAEETLRQHEREISTLAENATDMIVRFDTDLRHVYCNAAVELQLGVPVSTFIGKTPLETGGSREQAEFIDKSLRQVLETGQEQEVEQSYPTPSGSKHFLTRIVPERDEQGKIESLLAITRDITERKQAETELHIALEKYRVLFESFPLGISVTDAAGIIIEVNRESERLLVIPFDEHTRRKFDGPEWRIVRPDGTPMPPDEYASVRALREKRLVEDVEMGIVKDGGEITWISVTAAPIPLEGYGVAIAYGDITERKRAEEALKESESLLREAQAAAHIGHWAINPSIMIPTWSEEIFHIFGLDPKKSAPSFAMHQTITHPDDWDILNNAVTTSIADGTPFNIEFRIIRPDKAIRWMHAIGYPKKTSKSRTESLFGTAQDITERKQAEEALRESEGRFRLLYEKAPLGYQSLDAAGCFIDVNQAWLDTLGYSREEVIGRWFGDFLAPHEVEAFKQRFPNFKAAGEIQVDVEMIRKDGSHAIIDIVGRIAYDEQGGFKQTHCILTDITERKRAEEALRESQQLLERTFASLLDAVFVIDAATTQILDCNPAASEIFGYKPEEMLGRTTAFLHVDETSLEEFRVLLLPAVEKRGFLFLPEFRMKRRDGIVFATEHSVMPLEDGKGQRIGWVSVIRDITERKRAEEALRESRARLAHLSRRLVDAQEQERRRIARELHDEVGQSLTALNISLDGVSRLAMDGAMRGKIAEIQALTKHLIAEVGALSVELRPRVLDDLGLIPGLIALFNRFSTQTGVEIDFKHTGIERKRVTPEIEISAYRIIQEALTNVVRHAGVKTASVRLQVEADILWIQVQDDGKGFDLQQAMKAEDSMGLLSMIERAEQVGGHLEVETAPGEGTNITCRLPLGESHVERRKYERDENRPGR